VKEIKVPEIGENVESGIVVAVHISVGDTVAVDDTVIELETDKALVEIPSPFDGRVTEVLAEAGAQMKVDAVIARLETDAAAYQDRQAPSEPSAALILESDGPPASTDGAPSGSGADPRVDATPVAPEPAGGNALEDAHTPESVNVETTPGRPPAPASPSIRRLARELGLDIHQIRGSGPSGRITESDVKRHVRDRRPDTSHTALPQTPELPDFSRWGEIEIEQMETVRRLTAQSTATSWSSIPHVTQFDEADVSHVMAFIEKNAKSAEKAGARLTITAIITRICALGLQRFPQFNASVDMTHQRIIHKRYVHIGIAVDTPRGLLVPVVRDADRKSILELAKAIADLAERARNKKIKPDELEGGTFTISNQGGIGGAGFTPIVLWPQVAILGISRSAVKPVYNKDRLEPRTILPLSLSYDHRIIDGADAARFLRWICDCLNQPLTLFLE
jgi:pyruvate dehydrogenase E2 component (dihydrolipoamide acetyltransferase)